MIMFGYFQKSSWKIAGLSFLYIHFQENLYFCSTAADHAILISNWILPNVLATSNQWRGDAMHLETKEQPLKHKLLGLNGNCIVYF